MNQPFMENLQPMLIDPSTCHVARAKDKYLSATDALMDDDNIRR